MRTLPGRAIRRAKAVLGLTSALACAAVIAATPAAASASAHHHHGARSHTVEITGVDFRYRIETHGVHAGVVLIVFRNKGSVDHQAQLFRLKHGVSRAKFTADLFSGDLGRLLADSVPDGGAAVIHAGGVQPVHDPLRAGTYAVVCFVAGPDGVPHFAKGMLAFFHVAAGPRHAVHHRHHRAAHLITAHDLTYTIPRVLERGAVYKFVDTDREDVHELDLGRLKHGKTVADAKAYFKRLALPGDPGPAPFRSEGGHGAVAPHGGHGWFKVVGAPGRYVAFCLVPDDKSGIPHAALGMVVGVRVK